MLLRVCLKEFKKKFIPKFYVLLKNVLKVNLMTVGVHKVGPDKRHDQTSHKLVIVEYSTSSTTFTTSTSKISELWPLPWPLV